MRDKIGNGHGDRRSDRTMTLHYHGTPITPNEVLYSLAGRCFCVSHAHPQQVDLCHRIGQSVMLDNGAFSAWKSGRETDWPAFYAWCDRWLEYPTTWCVIPDVVDGGSQLQDALLREWPHGQRGAPVWHMDEPLDRLLRLTDEWQRVCIGSTAEYAVVLSEAWQARMAECWNELSARRRHTPWIHMLRGMQCAGSIYPFASVDSTDIGQNHNRPQNTAVDMADRWDALQCPGRWKRRRPPEQFALRIAS
jgi:hypothetical protein